MQCRIAFWARVMQVISTRISEPRSPPEDPPGIREQRLIFCPCLIRPFCSFQRQAVLTILKVSAGFIAVYAFQEQFPVAVPRPEEFAFQRPHFQCLHPANCRCKAHFPAAGPCSHGTAGFPFPLPEGHSSRLITELTRKRHPFTEFPAIRIFSRPPRYALSADWTACRKITKSVSVRALHKRRCRHDMLCVPEARRTKCSILSRVIPRIELPFMTLIAVKRR